MIELADWELVVRELSLGALIIGIIFFVFSLITNALSFGDHDADHGHGGLDHGDVGIDIDMDGDIDISIDGVDIDGHDFGGAGDAGDGEVHTIGSGDSPAPLMLLLSTFFLGFGALGFSLYNVDFDSILRLVLVVAIPIGLVYVTNFVWKRYLSVESDYKIPQVKIDNQVTCLTRVDETGGLVRAETTDYEDVDTDSYLPGAVKMQAKTLPGVLIERDEIAYVVGLDPDKTLIIDRWPSPPSKQ